MLPSQRLEWKDSTTGPDDGRHDGGGSTAMALQDGTVVNHPSGTGGAERAVGDAIVFVPGR
ncbi:phosphodiester glycosidase family protein [Kribbella sp. CWNU-51]